MISFWRWLRVSTTTFVIHWLACGGAGAQNSEPYRLAAGDKVSVQVSGQPDFSSESIVDQNGAVRVPVLGDIAAANLTPGQLEKEISRSLEQGYIRRPVVSVRVVEFRPIYVVGLVRTPGPLAYRGGETVLAAIARAGGIGLADQGLTGGDMFALEERVRLLEMSRATLLTRRARLMAQQNGDKQLSFPDMSALGVDPARLAQISDAEQRSFRAESEAEQQEADALRKQFPRLEAEIVTLKKQEELEVRQRELNQTLLADYEQLAKQGLARKPTYIEARREEARIEANIARLKSEGLRAELAIGDLNFKLAELHNNYQRRVLVELRETDRLLVELTVTLPSAQRAVRLRRVGTLNDEDGTAVVTVVRSAGGTTQKYNAAVDFLLQPGDVVQVSPPQPPASRLPAAPVISQGAGASRTSGETAARIER